MINWGILFLSTLVEPHVWFCMLSSSQIVGCVKPFSLGIFSPEVSLYQCSPLKNCLPVAFMNVIVVWGNIYISINYISIFSMRYIYEHVCFCCFFPCWIYCIIYWLYMFIINMYFVKGWETALTAQCVGVFHCLTLTYIWFLRIMDQFVAFMIWYVIC